MLSRRVTLLLTAGCLLVAGCSMGPGKGWSSATKATRFAVQLANKEARRLYRVEPFQVVSGELRFERNRWHWQGAGVVGQFEIFARVSFRPDQSDAQVQVDMFSIPMVGPAPKSF